MRATLTLDAKIVSALTRRASQERRAFGEVAHAVLRLGLGLALALGQSQPKPCRLERRALYRGVFTSVEELREEIRRFIRVHNDRSAKPFCWTKTAVAIIEKRDKLLEKLNGTSQPEH